MLGWAFVDHCGDWPATSGSLLGLTRATGPLHAGAAKVAFQLPYPVTVGGYGPWRPTATSSTVPLFARATVIDVGGQRLAIVSLETVLVSDSVVAAIRATQPFAVWVTATHTHTGPGNSDPRLAAQVAAFGCYRPDVEAALVVAARQALEGATAAVAPAVMVVAHGTHDLTRSRSGAETDTRLTRVRFESPQGVAIAQWLMLAAHPTLASRSTTQLDPDYPGHLSRHFETDAGVTLVLQTAGANASPNGALTLFAAELIDRIEHLTDASTETEVTLGLATVEVATGRPDASRLAPAWARPVVENVLCEGASRHTEVSVLRLGPLSLVAVPAEVTQASAKVLEQRSNATVVLSLTNGYEGYLEPEDVVVHNTGEAHVQYFGPGLLGQFAEAAHQAGEAAGTVGAK